MMRKKVRMRRMMSNFFDMHTQVFKRFFLMNKIQTQCGKWHSRSNISKHRKTCMKCKSYGDKFDFLETENKSLRERVAQLEKDRSTTTVVNINNINVMNVVPFSKEPVITTKDVKKILEPAQESVPKYIIMKHFTHAGGNLRIPNKNQQRIQVFCEDKNGTTWITKHKMDFLKELTTQSLCELVEMGAEKMSEEWKFWFRHQHQSSLVDVQIKNEEKLTKLVMFTILDNQK